MDYEFLEPDSYSQLSLEISEKVEDYEQFFEEFSEFEEQLEECLSEQWNHDLSGNGDFFVDGEEFQGYEMTIGLTSSKIMSPSLISTLLSFLEAKRSHWLIEFRWCDLNGQSEGLMGRGFVYRGKVYFDLSYSKGSYLPFIE